MLKLTLPPDIQMYNSKNDFGDFAENRNLKEIYDILRLKPMGGIAVLNGRKMKWKVWHE